MLMIAKNLYFFSMQSTYQGVECALYHNDLQLEMHFIKKIDASAALIPCLDELLKTHNVMLSTLSFIVVNQGPAPFTTLRVLISSVNGISFATKVPLIGVDGLGALLLEYYDSSLLPTVALLDAFANDVYYGIQEENKKIVTGCLPISVLLQKLDSHYPVRSIRFLGNGALLHKATIQTILADRAIIQEPLVATCSVEQIAKMGLQQWNKQEGLQNQLLPLYLKKQWWQTQNA
jgi:tRNA threonylcarbamoyl adenosine modification protein YeaZ